MSKKGSTQSNTLLNYFQSPKSKASTSKLEHSEKNVEGKRQNQYGLFHLIKPFKIT